MLRVCVFLTAGLAAQAADPTSVSSAWESIQVDDLRKHVVFLASDELEGREAGTTGGHAAGDYVRDELKRLGIRPACPEEKFFQHFGDNYRNVLGVLAGSDPELKKELVLIGAHYDHVGYGTRGNSRGPAGHIHNGADDNASGTAGLLEVAEAFASFGVSPKRSILFAFWDAEEKGLLGSEHWVSNPTRLLADVRLAVNADMLGRLRENSLAVFGIRTAVGLRRLVSEQNRNTEVRCLFSWRIKRDSDHYSFYQRGIPVLMLHTGKHEDLHRPSDDVEKLNLSGMQRVTQLLFGIAHQAAQCDELPAFRESAGNETVALQEQMKTPLPQPAARLGLSWDAELALQRVVQVADIVVGSSADRGGLKTGDRIVEFGGNRTDSVDDFRLLVLTARNPVPVVVQRPKEAKDRELTLQLDGEPLRIGFAWRQDDAEPGCVILNQVVTESPADRAGLQVNDRVYSVASREFHSSDEFYQLITDLDSPLELVIERDGCSRKKVLVLVEEAP